MDAQDNVPAFELFSTPLGRSWKSFYRFPNFLRTVLCAVLSHISGVGFVFAMENDFKVGKFFSL